LADVIRVQPAARVRLSKNSGVLLYDQEFAPDPATYTKHVGQAISIAPSATATLSLGGIAAVRNFLLQSDTKCTVKVNGQAAGAALVGSNMVYAIYSGSLTQIEVENNHTTNTASIQYIVTD
jgi:hypothetical protein